MDNISQDLEEVVTAQINSKVCITHTSGTYLKR